MKESGKITKKEVHTGEGKNGPWVRIAYTVNGRIYSTFNEDFSGFKEGDMIELEFEKDPTGKYNNAKTIVPFDGKANLSSFKNNEAPIGEIVDTQRLIIRQNSITNANYIMRTCYEKLVGTEDPVETLKKIAEKIEAWVLRE